MLRFHILNVGQGDSIVIEYFGKNKSAFAVVDSNRVGDEEPRALTKLRSLGADALSFICLTHPHMDHYRGLSSILSAFEGKIDQFFWFPAGDYIGKNVKKLTRQYKEIADSQDNPEIHKALYEFVSIMMQTHKDKAISVMPELSGPYSLVAAKDFDDVEIYSLMPFRKMKGAYLDRIRQSDPSIFESDAENEISVAILLCYKGVKVILGGDASAKNWRTRADWERTRNLKRVNSEAVKLPHHGSKRDCTSDTLDVVFRQTGNRYAFISADGIRHPDVEVLTALEERGIRPYCTNLHSSCGANVQRLIPTVGLDPVLGRYLNQLASAPYRQACQGDITFSISDDGECAIDREYQVPCAYRGEVDDLLSPLAP